MEPKYVIGLSLQQPEQAKIATPHTGFQCLVRMPKVEANAVLFYRFQLRFYKHLPLPHPWFDSRSAQIKNYKNWYSQRPCLMFTNTRGQ